jgi:hypothetical protein
MNNIIKTVLFLQIIKLVIAELSGAIEELTVTGDM